MTSLLNSASDRALKKKLEKVYDILSTSQVKTHPNVLQLESQILSSISDLRISCQTNETEIATTQADSLLHLVEERNRQLKILN
jgi:hypothetical protein